MKKILTLIGVAALLTTNNMCGQSIQDVANAITGTNAAIDFEALRGLKGNKDIFAGTYIYNMTTNAALLVSYDQEYTTANVPNSRSTSLLKGGLSLGTTFRPLENWFSITNFVVKTGVYEEAGTETSGPNVGDAINVAGWYGDTGFHLYKSVYLHIGMLYQNRTQQGYFGGNYFGVRAGIGGDF